MRFGQLELDLMERHSVGGPWTFLASSLRFSIPFNVRSFHWPVSFDQVIPETTRSIPETCTLVPGRLQKRSKIGLQR